MTTQYLQKKQNPTFIPDLKNPSKNKEFKRIFST